MLFRYSTDNADAGYWLNSRSVNSVGGSSLYRVRIVEEGNVNAVSLGAGYSDRFVTDTKGSFVRPIVYLKSNIQTDGKDTNGAWTIIDK